MSDGRYRLFCKGADSVIEERLAKSENNRQIFKKTQDYCNDFAQDGLRTLFVAERYIGKEEYTAWHAKKEQAKLALKNREEEVAKVDELIEHDLELIGSTAIEDRL